MTSDKVKRKLTAILSADVKGYSRLMGEDEEGTIRTLKAHLEVISGHIEQHQGRIVATGGDSVLAEFASVVDAVRCAVEIQKELRERNRTMAEGRRLEFRMGVNLGDVVEEGDDILGDGVNIAARLEGLSEAGGICISGTAFDQVRSKLDVGYEYIGEQPVKNIALPVRSYKVLLEPEAAGKVLGEKKPKTKKWGWKPLAGAAVLVLVLAGGLIWNFYFRASPAKPPRIDKIALPHPDQPSIAVLPFTNLSGDPKQEYFSDGITEDIITALSKAPSLLVIARNSTFTYKGKPVKIKQVSEELGVRYVLEGSVQKSGDRVRITAQLIDGLTGHHLWAERYERELKDVFAVQDEVTKKILTAMRVKLTEGEEAASIEKYFKSKGKQGLACYLKGMEAYQYFRQFTVEDNIKSRQIGQEMLAMCPEDPFGYLNLGWTYWMDLILGTSKSPMESFGKAMAMAKKVLAMDDSVPNAHSLLSQLYVMKRDYVRAIAEGERAVALDPNGAMAHENYAHVLYWAGWPESAIPVYQKAVRLNPYGSASLFLMMGHAYRITGQYEEAVSNYQEGPPAGAKILGPWSPCWSGRFLHNAGPGEGGPL